MRVDPVVAADELTVAAQLLGTPQRAESERRYLKSDRVHFGTAIPQLRVLAKRFLAAHHDLHHDELVAVSAELWDAPVHERRVLAVELLDQRPELLGVPDLVVVEEYVRDAHTWALVDPLAGHVAADIVAADLAVGRHDAVDVLDRWVADELFWVRRSAVLALSTALRQGRELDRFVAYADRLLDEREFFIRKVLGWVARDTGRRHPDVIGEWLRDNLQRMNGVTIREAVKYLPDGPEIVAEWKRAARVS